MGRMGASTRWHRWLGAHPRATDACLPLLILAVNLLRPGHHSNGQAIDLSLAGGSLSFTACTALLFRRRYPLVVLGATTAVAMLHAVLEGVKSPITLPVMVAMYTVVVQKDRLTRTAAAVGAAFLLLTASVVFTDGDVLSNIGIAVLVLLATAIGEAVRYRRAYEAEIEARLQRAEQSREEEALRRVVEERLRIAHELHDVIAHHIALMNVQAGVASHLLREQPAQAEHALGLVRDSGRTVLDELTVLLGVLRRSEDVSLPTAPTPSLRQLDGLIESATTAGLKVDCQARPTTAVPDLVELTAYRVLQESLTNVVKHAPGAVVRLRVDQYPGSLSVDVTDDGGTTPPRDSAAAPGTGHGLLGMRERVTAVGGDLTAAPVPGGGFRVHALLPLPLDEGAVRDDPGTAGRRPEPDPQWLSGACRFGPGSRGGR